MAYVLAPVILGRWTETEYRIFHNAETVNILFDWLFGSNISIAMLIKFSLLFAFNENNECLKTCMCTEIKTGKKT